MLIPVFQCESWNISLDTAIPVWILRYQCGFWDSSVDLWNAVWSLDSSKDAGIPVRILGLQYGFQLGSWSSSVNPDVKVWTRVIQYRSCYCYVDRGVPV